jgi:hypothetical protein
MVVSRKDAKEAEELGSRRGKRLYVGRRFDYSGGGLTKSSGFINGKP